MEKVRQLYFERVQNSTIDFERFIDYFKWIDDSISHLLVQLFPASADYSPKLWNMIESHVLERNKYWTKYPSFRMLNLKYEGATHRDQVPWERGHAPVSHASNNKSIAFNGTNAESQLTVRSSDSLSFGADGDRW